ncbi:MAG TPA: hypothetical protein VEQ12_09185 [Candidatus Limnocylindria bacterium]|nr:hypothetical protein [Candidatus Limnocylindria bacterium]
MSQALPYLLILVCPISMGLMMWYMMRPQKAAQAGQQESPEVRLARLEREIEILRAAHEEPVVEEERPAS